MARFLVRPSRRDLLAAGALSAAGVGFGALGGGAFGQSPLPPTPACDDGDDATPRQTEGPFYTPNSPRRANLIETGMSGTPIVLSGLVLSRACRPLLGAVVDLWHVDDRGAYDNDGFRLRGHVLADDAGRFSFRTIKPAAYVGRTRHFHVKVKAPAGPLLTTQLYFPDEPGNRRDRLFNPDLLMAVAEAGDGLSARFDFVLDMR